MHYAVSRYERELKHLTYQIYVTDMLRNIPQMTYLTHRWIDGVKSNGMKRDTRTAEQIAEDVIKAVSGGSQ